MILTRHRHRPLTERELVDDLRHLLAEAVALRVQRESRGDATTSPARAARGPQGGGIEPRRDARQRPLGQPPALRGGLRWKMARPSQGVR